MPGDTTNIGSPSDFEIVWVNDREVNIEMQYKNLKTEMFIENSLRY